MSSLFSILILATSIIGARATSIIGARVGAHWLTYLSLALMVLAIVGVVFGKLKHYPILIYSIGLSLLFQVTLMTNWLVGTDIHGDYYYAQLTYFSGHWDTTIKHSYNSSFTVAYLTPMFARITHIPLVWVFKVIYPMIFATVPLMLYYIFKRNILKPMLAFVACMFFVIMPVFMLEIVGNGKQMIGEFFLVAFVLILLDKDIKVLKKSLLLAVIAMMVAFTHYTMAIVLGIFIVGYVIVSFALNIIDKRKSIYPIKYLVATMAMVALLMVVYYGAVAQGKALRDMVASARGILPSFIDNALQKALPEDTDPASYYIAGLKPYERGVAQGSFSEIQETTVKAAVGLDFNSVDALGKVFRVIQYATEIFIIIGGIWIVFNRNKVTRDYLAFVIMAAILLGATVIVPGFSYTLNATRWYHLTLIFLSPIFVLGALFILRNIKLVVAVMLAYFLFTSGIVFEATQQKDLMVCTIPYSYALSGERLNIIGFYSQDDLNARDWIIKNSKLPVFSDQWGGYLMYDYLGDASEQFDYYPQDTRAIPNKPGYVLHFDLNKAYIFIDSEVAESDELTVFLEPGLRETRTLEKAGFNELLAGRDIVYQSGQAKVYGMK